MKTGDRVKQRRIQLGISVDELASKLGKNRATVYRYENNDIENLPISILPKLAEALGTTPAYLMGWTSNPNVSSLKGNITPISAIKCDTDDEKKLLLSYRTLSAPSKKKVLSYCNGLADIEKADFELNAAHALPNATEEDKLHDEDIMDDDNF